jgi:hypothetical protein
MGVQRLVVVPSPYNASELFDLDFEQERTVMYLAHLNHKPFKLTRASHTEWAFSEVTFGPTIGAPTGLSVAVTNPNTDAANGGDAYFPLTDYYVVTAVNDETGQESRPSNVDSATNDLGLKRNQNLLSWVAPADGLANRYRVYKKHENGAYGYIGTTTDLTFLDDNITADQTEGPPEAFNPFVNAGDYPSTVSFHEQRTIWGRTTNRPNAIWGSRSGDFENMDISRPLRDDDAFAAGLVAAKVNSVNQLVSTDKLYALCSSNIFSITSDNADYLTPKGIKVRRQIGRGSSRLNPIVVDNTIFYRPQTGSAMRALGYSFELDGTKSDDMTIFSPHFFEFFGIVDWAYTEEPNSAIWAVRNDGKLLCFTWEQEQQVWGWTLCETDGFYRSVCAISEAGEDRLYLVVERTIAGDPKHFIERMASARFGDVDEACFMDCARTFRFETPTTHIEGLFNLEFKEVVVIADGVLSRHIVSGGEIDLDTPALKVTVGLPFTAEIETLPLAYQSNNGWVVGRRQQPGEVVMRLKDSRAVLAGPNANNLYEVRERTEGAGYGPPQLLNGLFPLNMPPTTGDETTVLIRSEDPLPLTVTAVYIDNIASKD